jgi:hypothetical protein
LEIILNEKAWAENAIKTHELGKHPYETLSRVAKYYADKGCGKQEVRQKIEEFFTECEPALSPVVWSDVLDGAAKSAMKHPLVQIDCIKITKPEMAIIESIHGVQLQRLAFTLLCVAKYRYAVNPQTDHWVTTPRKELMQMANVSTSVERRAAMFRRLSDLELIRFSKRIDNLNIQVLFSSDGETAMRITDFRNLGYQYMRYHGGKFIFCERCGVTVKADNMGKRGRPQLYCTECANKIRMEQNAQSAMRHQAQLRNEVNAS